MKKNYFLTLIALIAAVTSWGAIPEGYYQSLDGKNKGALKNAAKNVVRNHTAIEYGTQTWNAFKSTDVKIVDGVEYWWDMYSDELRKVSDGNSGMNIEHSVANSWWGGTKNDAYKDLFHLNPSDATANNRKNNFPLGIVDNVTYTNGVTIVGKPASGASGGAKNVFEPADMYKGDFARAYFYMFTVYDDIAWETDATDRNYMFDGSAYPSLRPWAYEMLLEWAAADPVDQKEIDRNEAIYKIQGNRNPYIDIPDLAEYIWGANKDNIFSLSNSEIAVPGSGNGDGTLANPLNIESAYQLCLETGITETADSYYIRGYVTDIREISTQYGNATFTLADNADGTGNTILAYRLKDVDNAGFTDENRIKLGDLVVVYAKLVNFKGNTPEATGGYLVSINGEGSTTEPSQPDEPVVPSEPGTYNFVGWTFPGASEWTPTYSEHIVEFVDATVTFEKANHQGSGTAITDCPVTKGNNVTIALNDPAQDIESVSAVFKQWASKKQTVTINISTNGSDFVATNYTTSDFSFSNVTLPEGVKAVRFTFSSQSDQIGIASISLATTSGEGPVVPVATLNVSATDVNLGTSIEGVSEPEAKTINITATNNDEKISYTWEKGDIFNAEGTLTTEGGALQISLIATEPGEYADVLNITAGNLSKSVKVTAKIIEKPVEAEGTYNFVGWTFPGADQWKSNYEEHVVDFGPVTVTFEKANRQAEGTAISVCPVTKGNDVTVALVDPDKEIATIGATFKQWGTKKQTATINVSYDGSNFEPTEFTTSDFLFAGVILPAGVKAVRFTFSSKDYQIGIASVTVIEQGTGSAPVPTPTLTLSATRIDLGEGIEGENLPASQTLTITATNVVDPVSYSWQENGIFSAQGNLTEKGGTLTISLNKTEVGEYHDILTVTAGELNKEVSVFATIIEKPEVPEGLVVIDMNDITADDITAENHTEDGVTDKGQNVYENWTGVTEIRKLGYTLTFGQPEKTTAPAFYTAAPGKPWTMRVYKNNVMTVTAPKNMLMDYMEIKFDGTGNAAEYSCNIGHTSLNGDLLTWNYTDPNTIVIDKGAHAVAFTCPADKNSRIVSISIHGDYPTGIEAVETINFIYVDGNNIIAPEGAEVYDLNGVRVAPQNVVKGIYIVRFDGGTAKVLVK